MRMTAVTLLHAATSAEKLVSPWHEIPLYAGEGLLHYICEIPKETSAKMEVATVIARFPVAARWSCTWDDHLLQIW